ncbi:MAG: glutamate decarboxylase [Nitrospirae bacterium]|nr:glutamate decarboxylase [Nitrospirota bacterium]
MLSKKHSLSTLSPEERLLSVTYGSRSFSQEVPRFEIPGEGIPAEAAYRLISDELNLDGNPALNLATFVTTWMEPEAERLIADTLNKNLVDQEEYPQTGVIQERVINMLARLFHAPKGEGGIGTATVGSSEAIMLALLAHKTRWKKERLARGLSADRPNIVASSGVHVVWEKFARYFEVELRLLPVAGERYALDPEAVAEAVDERTVCVGTILGSTYTGHLDPVEEVDRVLSEVRKKKGWDIPIHVDGASGGFVLPFLEPDLRWDFRLPQVRSINVSGHKYGLVYPGIGWLLFRDRKDLPEELIFRVHYLGGEEATYTLNFSRGSSMMLAQYYMLLRLGRDGYRRIHGTSLSNARVLAEKLAEDPRFRLVGAARHLPIVTFSVAPGTGFSETGLSEKIRERGWILPAYTLPPDMEDRSVLRVVVKENFSRDMADLLWMDIDRAARALSGAGGPLRKGRRKPAVC